MDVAKKCPSKHDPVVALMHHVSIPLVHVRSNQISRSCRALNTACVANVADVHSNCEAIVRAGTYTNAKEAGDYDDEKDGESGGLKKRLGSRLSHERSCSRRERRRE